MTGSIISIIVAGAACAWLIALACGLYEIFAMQSFKPAMYKKGKVVLETTEHIPIDGLGIQTGDMFETDSGRLKFISHSECLFCRHIFFRGFTTNHNIKGRIVWHNGTATIEGRIPLGIHMTHILWFAVATLIGLFAIILEPADPTAWIIGGILVSVGWASWRFGGGHLISVEKRRAFMVINEFKWLTRSGDIHKHKVSP